MFKLFHVGSLSVDRMQVVGGKDLTKNLGWGIILSPVAKKARESSKAAFSSSSFNIRAKTDQKYTYSQQKMKNK